MFFVPCGFFGSLLGAFLPRFGVFRLRRISVKFVFFFENGNLLSHRFKHPFSVTYLNSTMLFSPFQLGRRTLTLRFGRWNLSDRLQRLIVAH